MAFQPSADSVGIRRLGFKCSWWHPGQSNDAVASEPSIFSENHNYTRFFPCCGEHVRTYISGSRCAWWNITANRHTHVHAHTRDNSNEDNHVNTILIKIGEAIQPEALVAPTFAVSQE